MKEGEEIILTIIFSFFIFSKHHRILLPNFIQPSASDFYFLAIVHLHGIDFIIDERFSDKSHIDKFRAIDFDEILFFKNLLKNLYIVSRNDTFAEKNLNLKNIMHDFKIEVDDPKKFISPEIRQNIYLIFKEAITNICKHSDAKNVKILFRQERNQFFLSVQDDGSAKKLLNTDGLGLHNMKMRVAKIGASLEIFVENGYLVELAMKV